MDEADQLLEDPEDLDTLAFDFIEQEVGRLDFQGNWPNFGQRQRRVQEWLKRMGYPETLAEALLAHIQGLHQRDTKWPYR